MSWLVDALFAGVGLSILAYAIGGVLHIGIDQVHGSRLVKRYFDTTKREIVDPLRDELKGEINGLREEVQQLGGAELKTQLDQLEAKLESFTHPDVGAQFSTFLQSEDGRAWTGALAEEAATQIANTMTARITSTAGVAARGAQQELVKLIDGAVTFGNPIMDGLWAMAPRSSKLQLYNRLARVLRKSGLVLGASGPIVDAEGRVVQDADVEDGETTDMSAWEPPRYPA
jgi:hypothetical protein